MKKKFIIGNWKLNPATLAEAKKLAAKIDRNPKHTAVLCPPIAFLSHIDYPRLGAQDSFWMAKGAYTGQVSALQLKSLKVAYCLVGHSERRAAGDTDHMINAKIKTLQAAKIRPVLCIGHGTTPGQDEFDVIDVLKYQLKKDLEGVNKKGVIVAYEPVWAIGTGAPATAEHAEKIALFIKTRYDIDTVIYGASVNSANCRQFLIQNHIDGVLPGGASLLPEEFNKMSNIKL